MTFKNWSLAIATLMLVAPLSANALGISIVGVSSSNNGNQNFLTPGDTITFDLVLENSTNESVQALGLGVYGYDIGAQGNIADNRLRFVGAQQGVSVFNSVYVPGFNVDGIAPASVPREDGAKFPISNTLRVNLFQGVNFGAPSTGDGGADNGVAGGQTNGTDVHFQVTFQAILFGSVSEGEVTLEFGTGQFGNVALGAGGTSELGFNNAVYSLTVVPEPGTALLMGLGLAGLAARRR